MTSPVKPTTDVKRKSYLTLTTLYGEVLLTDTEFIVCGRPQEDDPNHNCDALGCSSVSHVLFRVQLEPESFGLVSSRTQLQEAQEKIKTMVEFWECPECLFRMDVVHRDSATQEYSCPNCAEEVLTRQLRDAQEDSARAENAQREGERIWKEVCADFRIEYDDHPVGIRSAIIHWMANTLKDNRRLTAEVRTLRRSCVRVDVLLRWIQSRSRVLSILGGSIMSRAGSNPGEQAKALLSWLTAVLDKRQSRPTNTKGGPNA